MTIYMQNTARAASAAPMSEAERKARIDLAAVALRHRPTLALYTVIRSR